MKLDGTDRFDSLEDAVFCLIKGFQSQRNTLSRSSKEDV